MNYSDQSVWQVPSESAANEYKAATGLPAGYNKNTGYENTGVLPEVVVVR